MEEQVGVGEVENEGAEDLGKAAAHDDAVEQARELIADRQRLLGTARAAIPDRERRHAKVLDEALLHHHERFRGEQVLTVIAVHVQARRRDGVALAQHQVLENATVADARALDVPAADAAAAQRVDEALVPGGRRRLPARRRFHRGVMQDGRLIDRAIDRARLDANDVRHCLAEARRRAHDVGRIAATGIERLERVRSRAVHIVDARRDRAVRIERWAEPLCRGTGHEDILRHAVIRRFMRTRQHGAGDGMIGDREAYVAGRRLGANAQHVVADVQSRHETHPRIGAGASMEHAGSVLVV